MVMSDSRLALLNEGMSCRVLKAFIFELSREAHVSVGSPSRVSACVEPHPAALEDKHSRGLRGKMSGHVKTGQLLH
jgi:hypothetical protein